MSITIDKEPAYITPGGDPRIVDPFSGPDDLLSSTQALSIDDEPPEREHGLRQVEDGEDGLSRRHPGFSSEAQQSLWLATMEADLNVLRTLLRNWPKIDVNVQDENGRTPLILAANLGLYQNVQLLLEHGATADAKDKAGWNAANHAGFIRSVDEDYDCPKKFCSKIARKIVNLINHGGDVERSQLPEPRQKASLLPCSDDKYRTRSSNLARKKVASTQERLARRPTRSNPLASTAPTPISRDRPSCPYKFVRTPEGKREVWSIVGEMQPRSRLKTYAILQVEGRTPKIAMSGKHASFKAPPDFQVINGHEMTMRVLRRGRHIGHKFEEPRFHQYRVWSANSPDQYNACHAEKQCIEEYLEQLGIPIDQDAYDARPQLPASKPPHAVICTSKEPCDDCCSYKDKIEKVYGVQIWIHGPDQAREVEQSHDHYNGAKSSIAGGMESQSTLGCEGVSKFASRLEIPSLA